jgi:hypothetical protein
VVKGKLHHLQAISCLRLNLEMQHERHDQLSEHYVFGVIQDVIDINKIFTWSYLIKMARLHFNA